MALRRLSSIVTVVLITVLSAPPVLSAKNPGYFWTVLFTSNYAGSVTSQFTHAAVRMKLDKFGLTIVTKAPDWHTYVFNEQNKKYIDFPYSEWKDRLDLTKFGGKKKKIEKEYKFEATKNSKKILGLDASEKIVKEVMPDKRLSLRANIWVAQSIDPPDQFAELLSRLLGIPAKRGLPLVIAWTPEHGKSAVVLDAFKIDTTPIPATNFEMPKGYSKVKDQMALMFDDTDLDVMSGTEDSKSGAALDQKLKELHSNLDAKLDSKRDLGLDSLPKGARAKSDGKKTHPGLDLGPDSLSKSGHDGLDSLSKDSGSDFDLSPKGIRDELKEKDQHPGETPKKQEQRSLWDWLLGK